MRRKWIAAGLAACFATAIGLPVSSLAADKITLSDIVQAAQLMTSGAELTPEQMEQFDLTGDDRLTVSDIVQMANRYTAQMKPVENAPVAPAIMITPESAQSIALGDIEGASSAQVIKCELDTEHGASVYEIEFINDGVRYDYEVQAFTGEIVKASWSKRPSADYNGSPVTPDEAAAIVLERVPGASKEDVKAEQDTENGVSVYEITLMYDGKKYEGVVAAETGELIEWSEQTIPRPGPAVPPVPEPSWYPPAGGQATPAPGPSATPVAIITENSAKNIVLAMVPGASASDITKCELERKNGVPVYEIELLNPPREYDYTIHASNGTVLKEDWEQPPTAGYQGAPMDSAGAAQALSDAVPGSEASFVSTSYDTSHGVQVIEAELKYDGAKYEAVYVRATGELIEWTMEVARYDNSPGQAPAQPSGPAVAEPSPSSAPALPIATPQASAPSIMSSDSAKEIALQRVPGASMSDVVKCELEHEHGRQVYEIEIRYNGTEYDVTVDALSGEITEFEIDH